jgi:hypothetical protein
VFAGPSLGVRRGADQRLGESAREIGGLDEREEQAGAAFFSIPRRRRARTTPGTTSSPPLARAPGEPYPVIRTAPSTMTRLETTVMALLGDRGETISDLQRLVASLAGRSGDIDAAIGDAARSLRHGADASARLSGSTAARWWSWSGSSAS